MPVQFFFFFDIVKIFISELVLKKIICSDQDQNCVLFGKQYSYSKGNFHAANIVHVTQECRLVFLFMKTQVYTQQPQHKHKKYKLDELYTCLLSVLSEAIL